MNKKDSLGKNIFLIRKKNIFKSIKIFLILFTNFLKKKKKKRKHFSFITPILLKFNVLKIFDNEYFKRLNFLLPKISNNNTMNFYKWKKNDILKINKFGILNHSNP